jgi:hypothetical protein
MAEYLGLSTQDVANAIAIIDICVKRGAIDGGELSAVGSVRDKLVAFVEANTKKTDEDNSEVAD